MIPLDNCSVHISRASTDWLKEDDIHRMLHSLALFTWSGPSGFYLFPTIKEKLEWIQLAGERAGPTRIEQCLSGLGVASSRNKPTQWRPRQMVNHLHPYSLCSISSDRASAYTSIPDDICHCLNDVSQNEVVSHLCTAEFQTHTQAVEEMSTSFSGERNDGRVSKFPYFSVHMRVHLNRTLF
jgi:hypothetical protein